MISSYGIHNDSMNEIIRKQKENLYQVACLRLFEAVHPNGVIDNVGNHPNAFFNSSFQYFKDVKKNQERKAQAQAST